MTDPQDKRREPRFEVSTTVPALWTGRTTPLACPVSDISKSGLFLEIEDPPAMQTQITIGPPGFEARGRVVFLLAPSNAHTLGRKAGVGVHLDTPIDPDVFLLRCREAEAEARALEELQDIVLDDFGLEDLMPPPPPGMLAPPSSSPSMMPPVSMTPSPSMSSMPSSMPALAPPPSYSADPEPALIPLPSSSPPSSSSEPSPQPSSVDPFPFSPPPPSPAARPLNVPTPAPPATSFQLPPGSKPQWAASAAVALDAPPRPPPPPNSAQVSILRVARPAAPAPEAPPTQPPQPAWPTPAAPTSSTAPTAPTSSSSPRAPSTAIPLPAAGLAVDMDLEEAASPAPAARAPSASFGAQAIPLPGAGVNVDLDMIVDDEPATSRAPSSSFGAIPLPGAGVSVDMDMSADEAPMRPPGGHSRHDDIPTPPAPSPWTTPDAPVTPSTRAASVSVPLPGVRPSAAGVIPLPAAAKRARKWAAAETRETKIPKPYAPQVPPPDETPTLIAEVVLVEGVPGQALLAKALALDDYTPLVARHGLEGLTLCLRRRPLLVLVGADAARLPGRLLIEDLRRRPELAEVRIVLVDGSDAADPPGATRWREAPADATRARRLIDEALGEARARATTTGSDDAREIATAVAELGKRLHDSGEVDAGVSALRYAAELAPTVSAHTLTLSRVLLASPDVSRRAEAAALVERVARQDPRATEAYLLRAAALDQRGEKDEAKKALQRCLLLSPHDVEATAALTRLEAGEPVIEIAEAPKKKKGFLAKLFGR